MTLKEHINDIRNRLKTGGYIDETDISNRVVVRLLRELEWPIFDEWTVIHEYPVWSGTGLGKVDLALCNAPAKPIIFIEMKAFERFLDKSEEKKSEKQLFQYICYFQNNSHRELPIAILTDGQKWRFFHPMGKGNWRNHPVRELDFIKNDVEESALYLNRYLNYKLICMGEAIQAIKGDYQSINSALPENKVSPRLRVTMPNGEVIADPDPRNTFVEVIVKLGLENVARNRPTVVKKVSDVKTPPFTHYRERNGFYINTGLPLKGQRRTVLISIGMQLCVPLRVEREVIVEELPLVQSKPPVVSGPLESPVDGPYEWKDKPLTPSIAASLIRELFQGKRKTKREIIIATVERIHSKRGGLPRNAKRVDIFFAGVLRKLRDQGLANNVDPGYWEIYKI